MKKALVILFALFSFIKANSQEFSFQMYFTDALGNKDTITIGYDPISTDSIDGSFNEINIITLPLDTSFDVRITNEWQNRTFKNKPGTFHTKKQITPYGNNLQTIDIHSKHWPVTATWDNNLFNDFQRKGSVFTSVNPGGWWDTGSPSDLWRQVLSENDSVIFSSNTVEGFNENYGYIKGLDTIPVFWQMFSDTTILYVSIPEVINSQQVNVYPNPAKEKISVSAIGEFGKIILVQIYSANGKLLKQTKELQNINIGNLRNGAYFLCLTNEKGQRLSKPFIKL